MLLDTSFLLIPFAIQTLMLDECCQCNQECKGEFAGMLRRALLAVFDEKNSF